MEPLSPMSKLTARLTEIEHVVRETKRATDELLALAKRGKTTATGGGASGNETMHVRVVFSLPDAYMACLMQDARSADGRWEVSPDCPLQLTLRIRKTPETVRLIEQTHALTATDVVRVTAAAEVGAPKASGRGRGSRGAAKPQKRTLAGMYKHFRKPDGSERRLPKPPTCFVDLMDVRLESLERVATIDADLHRLYALAADAFPPSDGIVGLQHALSVGLMMPRAEDSIADCLSKLGVSDPDEIAFFERSDDARIATDPRFQALMSVPRVQFTNIRARNIADRARGWTPDTVVLPPRAKADPLDDAMSIPVSLKPTPAAPSGPRGSYKLRDAQTGAYGPTSDRQNKRPRAFVRRAEGASRVVAYVCDGVYTPGSGTMPLGEDIASYQWYPPYLSLADTFGTRLEAVSFDGDKTWSDADVLRALGLAKRVQWTFEDPNGEAAKGFYDRVKSFAV